MSPKSAKRKGKNGREDAGLEEKDERKRCDTGSTLSTHSCRDEYYDHRVKEKKDVAGFDDFHASASDEATNGKESLSDSKLIRPLSGGKTRFYEDTVVDEVSCDRNLCTYVAELGHNSIEQRVLVSKWFVGISGGLDCLFCLICHVGICDLRDRSKEENDCEGENEAGNSEVDPLDGCKGVIACGIRVLENSICTEDRSYDSTNCLKRLGEIETHFRVLGWPAD